jgi:fatty-acyl-CoA synthase
VVVVVVAKEGTELQAGGLRAFLASKFAKWQLPDAFVFASELPHTSVGKLLKAKLREQYANWQWEYASLRSEVLQTTGKKS